MKTYGYFPGCSIHGSGKGYGESLIPSLLQLGIALRELEDWNCCGATVYMGVDEMTWLPISARNLAIAERMGLDEVIAPCSACFLTLRKTADQLDHYPEKGERVKSALKAGGGYDFANKVRIRHPLEVLVNDVGLEAIQAQVTRPLTGMKVACYYGCQIVRPYTDFDDPEQPTTMQALVRALGGDPVPYPLATRCCGGSLTGIHEEVGLRLNQILLEEAMRRQAQTIITVCPLCQFNLECYQPRINQKLGAHVELPVLYFSQLMGLAFGLDPRQLGFDRALVPVESLLASARS